jgi:ATP-dependent exoDNAse (exonuclease V) alpha subunit
MVQDIKPFKIELNEQFKKALNLMENSSRSVFITGKAGTGKSTLLEYFRQITKKKIVVLAPTGVAAVNVRGETIHSFFGFKPDITIDKIKKVNKKKLKIFKKLDTIVIDEISMVRADLLDCVDYFLRLNLENQKPFGGLQIIFIGDLYQLPPVVTSSEKDLFNNCYEGAYFFNAKVFKELDLEFVELEKIYRQKDEKFINILNAIRNNTINEEDIKLLNKCVGRKFPQDRIAVITLTTINKKAEEINKAHLKKLKSKIYTYRAKIKGEFKRESYPTDEILRIGIGAQVMLLNNDSLGRWINGTLGKIVDIEERKNKDDSIWIKLDERKIVEVLPFKWEIFQFRYNEKEEKIETQTIGSFTQYPLRLAWAVTIHKAQGKTFPRLIIDFSRGTFAPGQAYVALSRCVSLEGISLKKPFKRGYVFNDPKIVKFLTNLQYNLSEKKFSYEAKISLIKKAIEKNRFLKIIYLKPNGEKTYRLIKPYNLGNFFYNDVSFVGVEAICLKRNDKRVFRVDRILEIKIEKDKSVENVSLSNFFNKGKRNQSIEKINYKNFLATKS